MLCCSIPLRSLRWSLGSALNKLEVTGQNDLTTDSEVAMDKDINTFIIENVLHLKNI